MTAPDAAGMVWQVAGDLDTVPLTFADLPERARLWLRVWANSPREACEHVASDVVLYALAGYREAMCAACATRAGLDELARRCGRCSAPTDGDERALHAIFALAPGLLGCITMCGTCSNDKETNP